MTRSGWVDSIRLMPRTLLSAVPPSWNLSGYFWRIPLRYWIWEYWVEIISTVWISAAPSPL